MIHTAAIECECAVESFDFPRFIDHAWLTVALGIHRRMYDPTVDDDYEPNIVSHFESLSNNGYSIEINTTHRWLDQKPVTVEEVAKAFKRGISFRVFDDVMATDEKHVLIRASPGVSVDPELLSSPIFTLTPSCRTVSSANKTATCGNYAAIASIGRGRIMRFRKRVDTQEALLGPEEITLVTTDTRSQGLRLLRNRVISLSCPLGANPEDFRSLDATNRALNRSTNLMMVLRPYPSCTLSRNIRNVEAISGCLDRVVLSDVCGGTLTAMESLGTKALPHEEESRCLQTSSFRYDGPTEIKLRYADFEPNYQIANDIARQLRLALGISCDLVNATYHDYTHNIFDKAEGLSLEIIQCPLPDRFISAIWNFIDHRAKGPTGCTYDDKLMRNKPICIPLLKNQSTLIAFDARYDEKPLLTREALIRWEAI